MRKILFILLFIPSICFSQANHKKGIRLGNPPTVIIDSVSDVVYDTVFYSGSSILDLGTRPSERVEPQTLFTVRFDDGIANVYTDWMPLLDSLNIIGVAAVMTDSIGKAGFVTWEQVTALQDSGWEILSHSTGETDWQSLTDSEVEDQCSRSKDTLLAHGIAVNNIIPPLYSGRNLTGREISRKYYRGAGTGHSVGLRNGFNFPVIDQFNICAMRGDIGGNYLAIRANGIDSVKAAINTALVNLTWGVYFLHGYTVAKAIGLREILEYVQDSGISIVTYNQALDIFEPYITAGREFNVSERGVRIGQVYGEAFIIDDTTTKIGFWAGFNNDYEDNVAVGGYANYGGTGKWRVDIGVNAGRNGDGNSVVNIGRLSSYNSDMADGVSIGYAANHTGTGLFPTFGGYQSGSANSGHYSTGWGYRSARNNSGTRGTFFGPKAGDGNSGDYVMGLGENACQNNTKDYLFEIKQGNTNTEPLIKGFFDDKSLIFGCPSSAAGDAEIDTNAVHIYLDEGNDKLMFRVRYSNGSLATGEITLTPDP